jgi:AcrR family transcriptional regulator
MGRNAAGRANQTKQALARALKEEMTQKPLDKITIQELTDRCGIRRQNFYYHFEDVYDLLRWMFQEEAVMLLENYEGESLWQNGLLQLFKYIEENRAVCLCVMKSMGRMHLRRFLEGEIHRIIQHAVEQIGDAVGAIRGGITEDDIALMTHVYVVSTVGIIESWLLGEIDRTPEQWVTFADMILNDHIRGAKLRWEQIEAQTQNQAGL